jgi:hypothetical protein
MTKPNKFKNLNEQFESLNRPRWHRWTSLGIKKLNWEFKDWDDMTEQVWATASVDFTLRSVWILEIEFHYNNRDLDIDQLS